MATSRLAQHLPSLFGPSRRATWRLTLVRRGLSAGALLLALHLTLGATRPTPSDAPAPPPAAGAAVTLPLAAPADHLTPGDEVGVYLPGHTKPLAEKVHVVGTSGASSGSPVARVSVPERDIGALVEVMGDAGSPGFVLVRDG